MPPRPDRRRKGIGRSEKVKKLIAFRTTYRQYDHLMAMPDASAYIRRLIDLDMGRTCPTCNGFGLVPIGLVDHFSECLKSAETIMCSSCGKRSETPVVGGRTSEEDRPRVRQFERGRPFLCVRCWPTSATCLQCNDKFSFQDILIHVNGCGESE